MKEPFILRYAHLIAGLGLGLLFVLQWLVDRPEQTILLGLATVCCGISLGYVAGDRSMRRYRADRATTVRPELPDGTRFRSYSVLFNNPWSYRVACRSRNAEDDVLNDYVLHDLSFLTEAKAHQVADNLYFAFFDGYRAGQTAMLAQMMPAVGFSEVMEPVEMLPLAPEPDPTPEPAPEPPAGVLRRLQGRKVDL